jgi:uncharacterized damage-inducible protein DinB
MTYYGAQHLADSFRTVRRNTITLAEEIPADKYDFKAAPAVRSVAEHLTHVAVMPRWQIRLHTEGVSFIDFASFGAALARAAAEEQLLRTKDEILDALRDGSEQFGSFIESLDGAQLMLLQRLLGIVPHLTRQREAMTAQAQARS